MARSDIHTFNEPLLSVKNLRTHFFAPQGIVRAVEDVSFTVGRGETLAIVGESGSGKTVTAMSVMRLLTHTTARIVSGTIEITRPNGEVIDIVSLTEKNMRLVRGRDIAIIPQNPLSSLNPVFTIGNQIAESVSLHKKVGRRTAMLSAVDLLDRVGMGAPARRAKEYPHQLSGGMRQRAMIAMALASDPRLLIADEPTTALDVTIQAQVIRLLRRLQSERQMGMIFVTHDLRLVAEIADSVAVMYSGELVEYGPASAVLANPRNPYTIGLLGCIPRGRQGNRLEPIPGYPLDPGRTVKGCRFEARCKFAIPSCLLEPVALRQIDDNRASRCIRAEALND